MTGFAEVFPELKVAPPTVAGQVPMVPTALTQLRREQLHNLAKAWEIPVKQDGTKPEIMPALVAAEANGVFKTAAIHPYYLRQAAFNPDRPHENNDWGTPPKGPRPDNTVKYKDMQRRAKALGLGKACVGLKAPELAEAIRKAEHEQRQSESGTPGLSGHEGLSGKDREVGEATQDWPVERLDENTPEVER